MATHLEPDILDYEVNWAVGSITTNKARGGDGIPADLFQILNDDAIQVLLMVYQQIWKTQQWPQDWKMSVFLPIPKKGNAKGCSNYHTIALISYTSKVTLKILQARLQQYSEPRPSRCVSWVLKRQRNQRLSCQHLLDYRESKGITPKHLLRWLQSLGLCGSQQAAENSLRDVDTRPHCLSAEKPVCGSRSNS